MQPPRRARRGIPLIAAAGAAALVAGLLYLRANAPLPNAAPAAARVPTMLGALSVKYEFVSPRVGWAFVSEAYGYSGGGGVWIFQTKDGAAHWQQQLFVADMAGPWGSIDFFDTQHGYASAGSLYRTVDGGRNWSTVSSADGLALATFESPDVGWALRIDEDASHLYRTEDGGVSWTRLASELPRSLRLSAEPGSPSSSTFRGAEGWLGAEFLDSPVVYLTLDEGVSWRTVPIPVPGPEHTAYTTSVRLIPGHGVIVTVRDTFGAVVADMVSSNRGDSWRQLAVPFVSISADDITFVDATHWWLLRYGQMYKTADAGMTWARVSISGVPEGWLFTSAGAIDGRHGWLAMTAMSNSSQQALAMTADGGKSWRVTEVAHPGPAVIGG